MTKWVYSFGDGKAEGKSGMKDLLGGKGANLAEMSNLGLPVPPGFTITTAACVHYYSNKNSYPPELEGAKSKQRSQPSRRSRAASSAATPIRCSYRCAPVPAPRCRA